MSADVLERTDEKTTTTGNDDTERYAHYFRKKDIQEATATGKRIIALCGYKHRPDRDGSNYPACPICVEIHKGLRE